MLGRNPDYYWPRSERTSRIDAEFATAASDAPRWMIETISRTSSNEILTVSFFDHRRHMEGTSSNITKARFGKKGAGSERRPKKARRFEGLADTSDWRLHAGFAQNSHAIQRDGSCGISSHPGFVVRRDSLPGCHSICAVRATAGRRSTAWRLSPDHSPTCRVGRSVGPTALGRRRDCAMAGDAGKGAAIGGAVGGVGAAATASLLTPITIGRAGSVS
jgi:hypothetical protein